MAANAALLLGLTLALRDEVDALLPALPFTYAEWNFYRAAQRGLQAGLLWPSASAPSPQPVPARALVARYLPAAALALMTLGVEHDEVVRLLSVIEGRLANGVTGARWQRERLDECLLYRPREEALACMMEGYITRALAGHPVHEWDSHVA
jgi:hypothetical protein